MRVWPKRRERKARVEIIPMIDVMMFLLVFFVLISVNVIPNRSLNIAVPTSTTAEKVEERKRLTITIAPEGDLFLEGEAITLVDLPEKLRAAIDTGLVTQVVILRAFYGGVDWEPLLA
jgi:biopolymer transport protein ExbD